MQDEEGSSRGCLQRAATRKSLAQGTWETQFGELGQDQEKKKKKKKNTIEKLV
jgi:hypothetical protein